MKKITLLFTWGIVMCSLGLSPVVHAQEAIEITDSNPLFEDFNNLDSSADNLGLVGWTLKNGYHTGSTATQWLVATGSSNVVDGKSLQSKDVVATATGLLISPKLKLETGRQGKISFYMYRNSLYENKLLEGFKVYVNTIGDIYNYDNDGNIVISEDNTVATLSEPILHVTRHYPTTGLYQMEVNIPSEMAGQEFYVIFEAIQEYGGANYIDNIKIELIPNTPKLGEVIDALNFGFIKAGETASQEFTLTNNGTQSLSVSFSTYNTPSAFSVSPQTAEIAFNEQKTFTVNFSSSEVSAFNDTLFITTNGGNNTIALAAETYPTTAYYESFDASTNMPLEWTVAPNEGESSYTVKNGIGVNNSNAISVSSNSYYSSSIDTLYSPVVSGKVSFDCKKESSYSSSSSSFEAYVVNASGELTSIDLTATTSWNTITIDNVPEGSRIAFLMNSAYLDNFLAFSHEEIAKGVQLIKKSVNRPGSLYTLYAGLEKATKNELQFSFKNIGTQPIEAGTYNFTTQLVDENGVAVEGVTYKTCIIAGNNTTTYEDNVIPGPELIVNEEKTIKGYLLIDCEDEFSKLAFNVNVNDVENTHFTALQTGKSITIKPNKGDASLSDLEIGLTNKAITVDYSIRNSSSNGALTVSAITVPENSAFSVNAELPLVIPNNSSATIQITFDAAADTYTDTITVVHDGIGDTEFVVSGTMLSSTALLESFEGEVFPPILWEVKQTYFKRNTSEKFHGSASVANTTSSTDTIVTPLLHLAAGDSIAFAIKGYYSSYSSYETNILYSSNGRTWTLLKELKGSSDYYTTWKEMAVYMPEDFIEGDYYIGFASKNSYLDMIYGPQVVYQDHRIDIKGFSGKNTGMVNYTQEFTIDVACLGTEPETADSYSIALMNGEETIGNYTVEPMVLGDRKTYTCSWTPRAAGEASIYALLTLNGVVTSTDTITVNVAEEKFISAIMVGDLSTPTSTTYYEHLLYETLYTPDLLNGLEIGDIIKSVNLPYIAADETVKGYKINVWIGKTEKTALTTEKMSVADIENLAHIGVDLRFEVGGSQDSPIYFEMPLETPITYEGGNLSLIVSLDSIDYASRDKAKFFLTSSNSQSMKSYNFDNDDFSNYMDIWNNTSPSISLKQSIMTIELELAAEPSVVHGIVTRSDNSSPIEGAVVTMQSGEVIYTATTDATGAYSIDVLQPGKDYTMSVSHEDYSSIEGIIVPVADQDIEQNFQMATTTGIDHTAEKAMKIYTHMDNIHIEAGATIETVKVYSMSGSLCITEAPASESAVINAGGLKGIYVVEVQTTGSVKRVKVKL